MGGVWYATTEMMNEFSQETTDAIRRRDEMTARAHLRYVSNILIDADAKSAEYIDVYDVEVLMYGLDEKSKKWGWALVPPNLKDLHVRFWGAPTFV